MAISLGIYERYGMVGIQIISKKLNNVAKFYKLTSMS